MNQRGEWNDSRAESDAQFENDQLSDQGQRAAWKVQHLGKYDELGFSTEC